MSAFGTKRTCRFALHMSAFDPKRTWAEPLSSSRSELIRCPVLSLGGGNEAARVHHASRRRGGVAARGARAAAGDAGDWVSLRRHRLRRGPHCIRISPRAERDRLCRRPQCRYRISLGEDHYDRLPALAADLVRRQVAVIAATAPAALGGKGGDHDDSDRLHDAARPGRGWTSRQPEPAGWQPHGCDHVLRGVWAEAAGIAARVGPHGDHRSLCSLTRPTLCRGPCQRSPQAAARTLGLQLYVLHASTEHDIDDSLCSFVQQGADALLVANDPFLGSRRDQIVAQAARHAVPAIYFQREFIAAGGLMSYGTSLTNAIVRSASTPAKF